MNGSLAARLAALERRHLPRRDGGVRVIAITCISDPEPPSESLALFLDTHSACCERGWPRMVAWRGGRWCEEQPQCWACREES